ncbi:uncharacterized protein BCR38DRAFT_481812 [Pseudomassariella vexata]|uniref:Uncharacterized protein n=1 Tax=Pseudomassariella vexata TaxID=1141098 RepID=A0A1Y2E9T4_9PEZI|nr:uncharacterized protein BCR38DRAFT_481812 [Pseudomassariella vexata]ORY68331.1 hypothetical protein BCR38DRAFT_481812 [Pseudomassariella vexata]
MASSLAVGAGIRPILKVPAPAIPQVVAGFMEDIELETSSESDSESNTDTYFGLPKGTASELSEASENFTVEPAESGKLEDDIFESGDEDLATQQPSVQSDVISSQVSATTDDRGGRAGLERRHFHGNDSRKVIKELKGNAISRHRRLRRLNPRALE